MTTTQKQKTFYVQTFETPLRNFFKCPSKTESGIPYPYFFLQNKDNKTHYYRTKENGMSDVFCKYCGDTIEEKYLTFFVYQNMYNGHFTVRKEQWHNFIKGSNYSNENTIWGVFCIDEKSFILAHNKMKFYEYNVKITTNQYTFDAVEIQVDNGILFERGDHTKFGYNWLVTENYNSRVMNPDNNYNGLLRGQYTYWCPLPRQGAEHIFCIKEGNNYQFITTTFREITNAYHGNNTLEAFEKSLRRNIKTNQKQVEKDLRMKAVGNILVIPDDFDEPSFTEWQHNHPNVKKAENRAEYMKQRRSNEAKKGVK